MWFRGITVAISTVLLVAHSALADESNFRPYIVGGRAAGLGGAFTALSDDGSGGYYNPGGLAFSRRSSISLSASAYGLVTGSYSNALGPGHDFSYNDLNLVPVVSSMLLKLGAVNPDTGVPDNTLAFSLFVPDSVHNDDRDSIGSPQNAFFRTQNAQTLWAGAGYSRRLGPVGIGVMGYGLIGSSINQIDLDAVSATDSSQFGVLTGRIDISTLAVLGSLGIRVDVTDELSLGLSVFSPAVGGGKRRVFVRAAAGQQAGAPPALVVVDHDNLDATPTQPFRAQFGVAWQRKPWTLTADLVLLGPRDFTDNPELASQGLDRHFVRQTVVNGSFGGEYLVGNHFPLRAGLFTDFSASPSPEATTSARSIENSGHIHHYGLTFSGGYVGEHVRTDVGIIGEYGQGQDLTPQNLDFTNLVPTDVKEFSVYFVLATSYEF